MRTSTYCCTILLAAALGGAAPATWASENETTEAETESAESTGLPTGKPGELTRSAETVELESGDTVEVESGRLLVPESRTRDTGRVISIPYYRLETTAARPAPPVFLLAGGPGSSWIERFRRAENYAEVSLYREVADVILFDQRGGGTSLPQMECDQRRRLPLDQPLSQEKVVETLREMAVACRDHQLARGIDLAAYNTHENAADVDALRRALGYEQISLVGGSYGSHLALHVLRRFPDTIDRVILWGVEGPDHTWDDPAAVLAALERIAAAAEGSPALRERIPPGGLIPSLRTVVERVADKPETVTLRRGEEERSVTVDSEVIRRVARVRAGSRDRAGFWPELLLTMLDGDLTLPAQAAMSMRSLRLHHPMHYMMDCASGISAARRERIASDPATELLGDLSFEYRALCDVWDAPDLGPEFRADVESDLPALLFHGTWDTSTPIENARQVAAALSGGHLVEVVGGNHGAIYNLYQDWPPMRELVQRFLAGRAIDPPARVELPAVDFGSKGGSR